MISRYRKRNSVPSVGTVHWRNIGFASLLLAALPVATIANEEFRTSLSLSLTMTEGNSETRVGNAELVTEGATETLDMVRAGIEGNYGESTVRRTINGETERERSTTVENARLFAHAEKTLSERAYSYLDGSAYYDDIAQIDYRAMIGPGMGIYLAQTESTALKMELGASYLWEDVAGMRDDYLAVRLAQRFEHALRDTARIWQAAEWLPQVDDLENYLIQAEIGSEADLIERLSLRVVLRNKYDSTPGADLKRNDLTLIAGIRLEI